MISQASTFSSSHPLISNIIDTLNRRLAHMQAELDDLGYKHNQEMQKLSELILLRSVLLSRHFHHYDILEDTKRVSDFTQKQMLRLPQYLQIAADLSAQSGQPVTSPEMHAQRMTNWHVTLLKQLDQKQIELKKLNAEITDARTKLIPGMIELNLQRIGTMKVMETLDYSALRQEYIHTILNIKHKLQQMRLNLAEKAESECSGGFSHFVEGVNTALVQSRNLLSQMRRHLEYFDMNMDKYGDRIRKYLALNEQLMALRKRSEAI